MKTFYLITKNNKFKNILIAFLWLLLMLSLYSCEKRNSCKKCHVITYENGKQIAEDDYKLYCDDELENVEGLTSQVGNMSTKMVCR